MCGICGVVQVSDEPRPVVDLEVLDRMTDVLAHRGPDDRGTYRADGVALGVRRLSIVDVEGGHQPLANEDETVWAIQNGELYNHPELRRDLVSGGHRFSTRCDTEVIPHVYERDGIAFPEALRGKFGIAVWDERRRRAVLARDRLGVKPLYYTQVEDLLVFASELKGVLASGLVEPVLDYEAIDAYLTFGFIPGPLTPLAGVFKLLPGHLLIVTPGDVRIERYWAFPKPSPDSPRRSVPEYTEGLRDVLEDSVRTRLMSDVPLGAMLSGGLDSSLVVAMMARNSADPVKTFSVGFAEDHDFNELADARHVANALGTDHHELELSFADETVDLEELVWHLDEPIASLSTLGMLALSSLAAEHVKVAQCGQGADELLGGYERHRNAALAERWGRLPRPVRAIGERTLGMSRSERVQRGRKILIAQDPVTRMLAMYGEFDGLVSQFVRGPMAHRSGQAARRAASERLDGMSDEPLAETLYLDGQLALVDDMLHYFDRTSMARSLEVRVPFLDHHVVEYCATIPSDLKVHRLTKKYLLKRAARGLVPDRIIDKPKIGFFHKAVDGWIETQAEGSISRYLLSRQPRYAEFLDPTAVRSLVGRHVEGVDRRYVRLILLILILEIWLSTYLPRALRPPRPEDVRRVVRR
jgi:asparagine synthase (glutamine-hydrolysing)